jgi:hypothetical protein
MLFFGAGLLFCQPIVAQSTRIAKTQTGLSVVSVSPAKYSATALPTTVITATMTDSVTAATLTNSTFIVSGSITGRHQGQIALDASGKIVSFSPASKFLFGEKIEVTLTSGISSPLTGALSGGYTWVFQTKTQYGSGKYGLSPSSPVFLGTVYGLAAGDFDKDGFADIAATDSAHSAVNVLINNRHGGFYPSKVYAVGTGPEAIVSADVNGDGSTDLVIADYGSDSITVLKNNGAGLFGTPISYAVGTNPSALAIADVENNGNLDIVVAVSGTNSIVVLKNDGTGSFSIHQTTTVGAGPSGVALADFNGDGMMDLAVVNKTSSSLTLLNNTSGILVLDTTYAFSPSALPYGLISFDFDKNGTPDLAIANGAGKSISIYLNGYNGVPPGRFNTSFPAISIGAVPYALYGNDFDVDGDVDLAVANSASNVTVITNNGDPNNGGSLPTSKDVPAMKASKAIVGVDFSGLGIMDLVVSSADGKLRILRDSVLSGLSPSIAPSATSLNFGTTKDSVTTNVVFYSSALATRIDSIQVTVPYSISTQAVQKNFNPYDSLGLSIVFKPTAGILYSGSLKVFASTSAPSIITIPLSGNGDPSLAVEKSDVKIPQSFGLEQNYPNPFNPSTTINYQLAATSNVTLKVYDITGREVATILNKDEIAGAYSVTWDATRFASGIYLCKITATSQSNRRMHFEQTRKMLLLK